MIEFEQPAIHDPLSGRYAGFWLKFAAPFIDLIVFVPLYYGIKAACGVFHPVLADVIFTVIALAAYSLFYASKWQGSPGMRVLGFYITDREGNRISYGRSLLWAVVSTLGFYLCLSGVVYMQYRFDLNAVIQLLNSCREMNMRDEDCVSQLEDLIGIPFQTFTMMLIGSLALALFLMLVWALSVALAKDKSGFHNLICGTRFLKGRV